MNEDLLEALKAVEARLPNLNFIDEQLPNKLPEHNTITLYRENLERFRLSYQILLETVADIVNVDYRKLCVLDLLNYYSQRKDK